MKEPMYNENGFVKSTVWRIIKCWFGFHWWMCRTEVDSHGNYMRCPQIWLCRVCAKDKETYD